MSKDRPRAALSGPVDLVQLSREVGAVLSASATEVVVADPDSKVTSEMLAKSVADHKPPVKVAPEPPLTDDERRRLRALLAKQP